MGNTKMLVGLRQRTGTATYFLYQTFWGDSTFQTTTSDKLKEKVLVHGGIVAFSLPAHSMVHKDKKFLEGITGRLTALRQSPTLATGDAKWADYSVCQQEMAESGPTLLSLSVPSRFKSLNNKSVFMLFQVSSNVKPWALRCLFKNKWKGRKCQQIYNTLLEEYCPN